MFGGSGLAVGGALAAVALLYLGVKELLSASPKGIVWGAVLVAGAVALASFTGVTDSDAAAATAGVIAFAFNVVTSVVATVSASTGLDSLFVWIAVGLLLLVAVRGGGGPKRK